MTGSTTRAVVLATVLLVGAVPGTAAAQTVPRDVLFDQGSRHVATVSVEDRTYEVYRYDNLVPYASGIEIYRGGQRVTDASTARTVLARLAHRRALDELGPDDVRVLRASRRNVSDTVPAVASARASLVETTATVADLKTDRADGRTAYEAAVDAAPSLPEFNETANALGPDLRSYVTDAGAFTDNATRLVALLERRQNGTAVGTERLYDRYVTTLREMEAVSEHVEIGGFTDELSTVSRTSRGIATNVSAVPERGAALSEQFSTVHNETGAAASRTDGLELPEFAFDDARERANSLVSRWMNEWRTRQNAPRDIYGTLAGVAVGVVLVAGYVEWRRR